MSAADTENNNLLLDTDNKLSTAAIKIAVGKKLRDEYTKRLSKSHPLAWDHYINQINDLNPSLFFYLNEDELEEKKLLVRSVIYILCEKIETDELFGRKQHLPTYNRQMARAMLLLAGLEIQSIDDLEEEKKKLWIYTLDTDKPSIYLSKDLAEWLTHRIDEYTSSPSVAIRKLMGDVNGWRLYWVWGGSLLSSILVMLPTSFPHLGDTQTAVRWPSQIGAHMGYALYFARFFLNAFLLMKHTIKRPTMTEEELSHASEETRKLVLESTWQERFKSQWDQRKFILLNDAVWGVVNLITCIYLTGPGKLGYAGNILTVGLLLIDLSLICWQVMEERARHFALMNELENKLKALHSALEEEQDERLKKQIQYEIEHLEKVKKQEEKAFHFKQFKQANNLAYSASLIIGFAILTGLFLTPSVAGPSLLLILGVSGAALCFVLTVAYYAINGLIDIAETQQELKEIAAQLDELKGQYIMEASGDQKETIAALQMTHLEDKLAYQKKMLAYQSIKVIQSTLAQSLIPALVFASFILLPSALTGGAAIGAGLAVVVGGLLLMALANYIVDRFKPEPVNAKADALELDIKSEEKHSVSLNSIFPRDSKENENDSGDKILPDPAN